MKRKSYSFIRACFNYLLVAIVLGNILNMCTITVSEKSSHAIGFLYSIGVFTVIALLSLRETKIAGNFDNAAAIMMLILSCVGVLITTFAFYNTSLLFSALSESDRVFAHDYSDYNVLQYRFWFVSIGLGLCFGLAVLSGGALLQGPQEKRKVKKLS